MDKISPLIILQLLLGGSRLQEVSAELRSVRPGGNISLHCSISADFELSWYHQSSEQMRLLVSAGRGNLQKSFSENFNVDEGHYGVSENSSSVSLEITGVNQTDLGLYYCAGRNLSTHIQFSKPIRLTLTVSDDPDEDQNQVTESSPRSADPGNQQRVITLMAVCLVSILINIIGVSVFCYRVHGSSHICWRNTTTTYPVEKELHEPQYTSPVHNRDLRDTAYDNTTASTPESVIYAKIFRPTENSPA